MKRMSIVSGLEASVASMMPWESLTSVSWPPPRSPLPLIVLSTLVSVTSALVPWMTFSALSDNDHMAAAGERNALLNDQQISLVAGGVQFDGAGVIDCPAQRQDGRRRRSASCPAFSVTGA